MPYRVDPSVFELKEGDPPAIYGSEEYGPNPGIPFVKTGMEDRKWRSFTSVSTKLTIASQNPNSNAATKVSEEYELRKVLTRAARELGVSIRTRKEPGSRKDTVNLYWLVVDKIQYKARTKDESTAAE